MSVAVALFERAQSFSDWMTTIRRDLHQYPELGLEEHRTAEQVQRWLDEIGVDYRAGVGRTGVLGWIDGAGAGPERCVALRADLDALPIHDAKDVPYRSKVDGKMHACGHDVHTTILLGAARLLSERRDSFSGTVKLLFQPAEETVGGAQLMIADGVLEDPEVDAVFGLHVDADFPVGTFGVRYGQRNASSDTVTLVLHGRSAHGAYPSGGVDAIVIAAQVVTTLQTVVSRNLDARQSAVVSFGKIAGGVAGNIMANRVELTGTIRALDTETRELAVTRVQEVAEGVAAALGGRAEVVIEAGYDPLVNHDTAVDVVRQNAAQIVGEDSVFVRPQPNMGVEDFAYYVSRVPGAFFTLGAGNEERGLVHSVHTEYFDVDEACLPYGAALQALNALTVLSAGKG